MRSQPHSDVSPVGVALAWLGVFALLGLWLALPVSATPTLQSAQAWHATGRLTQPLILEPPLLATEVIRPPLGVDDWTVLLDENFDSSWPRGAWQTWDENGATDGQYTWANRCPSSDGTTSAWSIGGGANGASLACGAPYPYNVNSWARYGPLDLSHTTAGLLNYSFCIASRCLTDNNCSGGADRLYAVFSTDGSNFNGMWHAGYLDNYAPWCTSYRIDLSDVNGAGLNMLGQPQVWVAFIFQSGSGYTQNPHLDGAYIDNVHLTVDTTSCAATASITTLSTDKGCYVPGSTLGAFVAVTTSQAPQSVRAVAELWSGDVIWATGETAFSAPGSAVISVPIPTQLASFPGTYDLVVTLYDAASGCQQDKKTVGVRVDPVCGSVTAPVSPTATRTPTRTPTFTRTPTRTPTRTATPTPTGTAWAPVCPNGRWSHHVALVPGPANGGAGILPILGGGYADLAFTNLAPADISAAALAAFDTLVFNMVCEANTILTAQQKAAINAWVGAGNKFIIYDSDVCAGSRQPDYGWLMYPFASNNPGATGAHGGTLTIVEDNTLSSPDAGSPYYVDTANITSDTDAVGDANVMLARSQGWCGDMEATNVNHVTGWTHTYGPYGGGLVIYNGLDTDDIADNQWLERVWQFELCQAPGGLPCSVNIPPITATPTVTPTRFPTVTPTPTRTPTRTSTPTPTCVPPRPSVTPECSPAQAPNALRNPHFALGARSWGEFSRQGREVVNPTDHRAEFYGPPGVANHELLYQLVSLPPDAQSVSFWVGDFSAYAAAWDTGDPAPPPPPGLNYLRVSLYDATLTTELARLWQIDLAAAPNCEPDPSSYNLTPGELALVRGQTVALVFEFQKVTTEHNWTAGAKVDDIHLHVCSPSPPCRVNRDKTASPRTVAPGGETTVLLSLEGLDGACLPARQPSDVVLVLDRSGSMAGPPLLDAKTAAKGFVDRLDLAVDQVGIVSFANTASLDQSLTQLAGPPRAAIDALVADGVTNMADALRAAQAELTSARHLPANRPVLILLSDGRPNPAADERAVAAAARAAGTRIFSIGLGSQVDATLMAALASAPSDYFYAPDSTQLDRIYQQIAGAIGGDPATNIVIEDRLSAYVTLVPNSFTGAPTPSVSADGKTLTWRIPRLGLETRQWSYRVKLTQTPGAWPTNSYATATYTNSRGQPASLVFPIPQVTVLAPAAKNPQVMCKDYAADSGRVPSNANGEAWWDSPDIWVRNQPDNSEGHQNPLVGQLNYVTVRVRNTGDTAVNDIKVHVYAAPGAASIRWPDEWVPEIGTDSLMTLAAGATGTVKVAWMPVKEGHTCFLARIEAPVDPITADGWVPFDNNLCQKNVQVIGGGVTSSGVTLGNAHHGSGYGSLTVTSPPVAAGTGARVTFTDAAVFNRWQAAGGTVSGGRVIPGTTSISLDLQSPAALLEGGQEAHELTDAVVFSARLDRIPLAGDETTRLTFEVETPPNAEPPMLQITEWMNGQAVGGNVLRPAGVTQAQLYLPLVLKGQAP